MIERELQGLPPQRRYEERLKREKPLLDEFRAWADARTVAPKSKLGQAFVYLANQWTPLTNYLLDGRLEISNNRAEWKSFRTRTDAALTGWSRSFRGTLRTTAA